MKDALPTLRRFNRPFILLAAFALFALAQPAHADMAECGTVWNRMIDMANRGEAWLCSNQQQYLGALDDSAAACAGDKMGGGADFGAMKSQFLAGCSAWASAQDGGGRGGRYDSPTAPADNKAALNRARADGDRADQFLKDIQKCDQISDPDQRTTCRSSITRAYQGNVSGSGAGGARSGASTNSGTGSKGGALVSGVPDDDPDQQPKALPPPKDPGVDYSGQACQYFTRPALEDEVRLNYHEKGSCVSYGQSSYECGDDGRWQRRGTAEAFKCKTAEELESSSGEPLGRWAITRDGQVRDQLRGN